MVRVRVLRYEDTPPRSRTTGPVYQPVGVTSPTPIVAELPGPITAGNESLRTVNPVGLTATLVRVQERVGFEFVREAVTGNPDCSATTVPPSVTADTSHPVTVHPTEVTRATGGATGVGKAVLDHRTPALRDTTTAMIAITARRRR
jgi:hypothetical protein